MLKLLRVSGDSLLPGFREGDFVLLLRIPFHRASIGPGDIIAFKHPTYGTMIKKVGAVSPTGDQLFVVGTHPHSVDSRRFGAINRSDIVGKVIWHIGKPAGH